ncbi:hypothetical protein DL96DRAFT_1569302 [Flagelloscypha sp. PMI_526]|nr:hypothetical protein DL96DRAFT_1569302 [Flagelloscypha sp. PMI_526]
MSPKQHFDHKIQRMLLGSLNFRRGPQEGGPAKAASFVSNCEVLAKAAVGSEEGVRGLFVGRESFCGRCSLLARVRAIVVDKKSPNQISLVSNLKQTTNDTIVKNFRLLRNGNSENIPSAQRQFENFRRPLIMDNVRKGERRGSEFVLPHIERRTLTSALPQILMMSDSPPNASFWTVMDGANQLWIAHQTSPEWTGILALGHGDAKHEAVQYRGNTYSVETMGDICFGS